MSKNARTIIIKVYLEILSFNALNHHLSTVKFFVNLKFIFMLTAPSIYIGKIQNSR